MTRPALILTLAWGLLPIPIAGWLIAQGFEERIPVPAEFTGALIHTLATSTFAVILGISALINAVIVTRRFRDGPASYARRYPLWQGIALLSALGWLACIIIGAGAWGAEIALGVVLAITSIVTCVFAAQRDDTSAATRRVRLETIRSDRSPERARLVRRARIAVPIALAVAAALGFVAAQTVPVVHRDCRITGTGDLNGTFEFFSETCGEFSIDETRLSRSEVADVFTGISVDITTQGFIFDLPPQPVAIAIAPSAEPD